MSRPVQIGVIGAMQRSHPALTELWLKWTGINGASRMEFGLGASEDRGAGPVTQILVSARDAHSWKPFCDFLKLAEDDPARTTMPIRLGERSPAHQEFWGSLKKRELEEVDGPLEWWWRLLVLRQRGVHRASKVLLSSLFGEQPEFRGAVVSFINPSLKREGRRAEDILPLSSYESTKALALHFVGPREETKTSLEIALDDATLKLRLTSALIDLSVARLA